MNPIERLSGSPLSFVRRTADKRCRQQGVGSGRLDAVP